jgi:hypothetical protein
MLAVLTKLAELATTFCWQCQLFLLTSKMKNGRNLGLRLDHATTTRLEAFEQSTKVEGVTLARAALEAALDCYARTGRISFPLRIDTLTQQAETTVPAYLREQDAAPVPAPTTASPIKYPRGPRGKKAS